ncbi:hypothetical protein TNIN_45221 [Trichonephila inaurata madagascariensis]|uniref:Uncharacterized protein n=1 Tax=Trichonephila inaurata madagascariensis TaxID=2747483 RepID=A0A8X6YHD2_9ARAC|nr:hypothetical protein TNIN_45221 [Trichonephila inaurata madagascariensis]
MRKSHLIQLPWQPSAKDGPVSMVTDIFIDKMAAKNPAFRTWEIRHWNRNGFRMRCHAEHRSAVVSAQGHPAADDPQHRAAGAPHRENHTVQQFASDDWKHNPRPRGSQQQHPGCQRHRDNGGFRVGGVPAEEFSRNGSGLGRVADPVDL